MLLSILRLTPVCFILQSCRWNAKKNGWNYDILIQSFQVGLNLAKYFRNWANTWLP